jgi:hypothetical protein
MNVRIVVILLLAVYLTSCASVKPSSISLSTDWVPQVFVVEADVVTNRSGSRVVISTPQQCGDATAENGCISVPSGKVGIIQFVLDGGDAKSCEDEDTWVWKGVELHSMSDVDQTGGDAVKSVGKINAAAQTDFGAKEDGNVDAVTINGQYMSVRDLNATAYEIWYTLIAVKCGDSSIATTDPRVKNHGNLDVL